MPSQYSDLVSRSLIECVAQKLASTVVGVASHVTALAPFSQNSSVFRWSGSGHAQLMQSKPSFWLMAARVLRLRRTPMCWKAGTMEWTIPGTPAAETPGLPTSISLSVTSATGGLLVMLGYLPSLRPPRSPNNVRRGL